MANRHAGSLAALSYVDDCTQLAGGPTQGTDGMVHDPYRSPSETEPEPTPHERLLARVRTLRGAKEQHRSPTDVPVYDRESMRADACAFAVSLAALALLGLAVLFFIARVTRIAKHAAAFF